MPSRTVPTFLVNDDGTTTVTIPITKFVDGTTTIYADTYICSKSPETNYAKATGLIFGNGRTALLNFDLVYAALKGKVIKEATVKVVKNKNSAQAEPATIRRTYDDWTETLKSLLNVTYNNSYQHLVENNPYEVIAECNTAGSAGKELLFDITNAFDENLKSLKKVSFILSNEAAGTDVDSGDSVSIGGKTPCLVVTYL